MPEKPTDERDDFVPNPCAEPQGGENKEEEKPDDFNESGSVITTICCRATARPPNTNTSSRFWCPSRRIPASTGC